MTKAKHTQGPGLKLLSKATWYGGGYCAICGTRGEGGNARGRGELIPTQVRYWCPDDGWRVGVLCGYCGEEVTERGPRPGDYAFKGAQDQADRIGISSLIGDEDSTYSDHGQP